MAVIVSTPGGGTDLSISNQRDTVYVKGSEFVDGSARFRAAPAAEPLEIFAEERILGEWTLAPLITWEPNIDRNTAQVSVDRNTGEESREKASSHEEPLAANGAD